MTATMSQEGAKQSKPAEATAWRASDTYLEALKSTGNDRRLLSPAFTSKVNSWEPPIKDAFFFSVYRAVAEERDYKRLFDERVLDTIKKLNDWNQETVKHLLRVVTVMDKPDAVLEPKFLEQVKGMSLSLQKLYLMALERTKEFDKLIEPKFLEGITSPSRPRVEVFTYLNQISSQAKFMTFEEWSKSRLPPS